jgi:hypothetical protein
MASCEAGLIFHEIAQTAVIGEMARAHAALPRRLAPIISAPAP